MRQVSATAINGRFEHPMLARDQKHRRMAPKLNRRLEICAEDHDRADADGAHQGYRIATARAGTDSSI